MARVGLHMSQGQGFHFLFFVLDLYGGLQRLGTGGWTGGQRDNLNGNPHLDYPVDPPVPTPLAQSLLGGPH